MVEPVPTISTSTQLYVQICACLLMLIQDWCMKDKMAHKTIMLWGANKMIIIVII